MAGGENCTLSMSGYGSVRVIIDAYTDAITIIGNRDQARTRKAFYTAALAPGDFTITVVLGSDRAKHLYFNAWLLGYARRLADPNGAVGPMRVQIPSRKVDKFGILKTGITFGDNLDEVSRKVTLTFVGGRDPADFFNPVVSEFKNTTDPEGIYFYPGGVQMNASDDEDALYGGWNKPTLTKYGLG